ncbi:O-antigen ligase family protein [Rhodococcus sp. IEGM 1330]|uniref:O-antigen ligase family protein n=1 Tax=Rhodococcus sp. IEGM 1330 TaxID=3082225 RepID=UPI002954A152|nr:O-antigen ligase family protein [Rhodococcus sp. IEGM 1330]MDV8023656.1 O-antigen ligase family protein [Rhodococcus sp. IEGM 1330]
MAVALGRWGSYLKLPGGPFYLPDIAVGLGVLLYVIGGTKSIDETNKSHFNRLPTSAFAQHLVICASLLSVLCIAIGAAIGGGANILAIRDAMPFVYFAAIPLFIRAICTLGSKLVFRYLCTAVILHTIWIVPAKIGLLTPIAIPLIGGVPAFTTRNDFDMLICGLAIAVIACASHLRNSLKVLLIVGNLTAITFSGSRAGMIAGIVAVSIIFISIKPFGDRLRGPIRLASACAVLSIVIPLFVIFKDNPPSWAVGLQKLLPNDSDTYASGQNTWNARLYAWERLINYTNSDDERRVFGSGFGVNPVRDSGALEFLSGDPQVRAAHNFLITWYAFLGIAGAVAVAAIVVLLIAASFSSPRTPGQFTDIGRACSIGVLLTALGGVILESPFGYMTFTLSVAMAIARPSEGGQIGRQMIVEGAKDSGRLYEKGGTI